MSKIPPQLGELILQVVQDFLLFTEHGVSSGYGLNCGL
jgi:hypothetical protein